MDPWEGLPAAARQQNPCTWWPQLHLKCTRKYGLGQLWPETCRLLCRWQRRDRRATVRNGSENTRSCPPRVITMKSSTGCGCRRLSAFQMSQPLRERGTQEETETLRSEVTGPITWLGRCLSADHHSHGAQRSRAPPAPLHLWHCPLCLSVPSSEPCQPWRLGQSPGSPPRPTPEVVLERRPRWRCPHSVALKSARPVGTE